MYKVEHFAVFRQDALLIALRMEHFAECLYQQSGGIANMLASNQMCNVAAIAMYSLIC